MLRTGWPLATFSWYLLSRGALKIWHSTYSSWMHLQMNLCMFSSDTKYRSRASTCVRQENHKCDAWQQVRGCYSSDVCVSNRMRHSGPLHLDILDDCWRYSKSFLYRMDYVTVIAHSKILARPAWDLAIGNYVTIKMWSVITHLCSYL